MSLPLLVAHIRGWLKAGPKAFYGRFLDQAQALSDADLTEMLRFARTKRGAEMAVVHHIQPKGYL